MAQTKFTNIEHRETTSTSSSAKYWAPSTRWRLCQNYRCFKRECSSCFTCGIHSATNSQNLVNRINWVKGSIVISKLLHNTYMSLSPNISSIISITLSIGLAVTITLFTTSELIPRRRLKSGGLHFDCESIKHLCKILKSFIFTSTSTKHWPPSTEVAHDDWKLYQNLHMSIERVKPIYRFYRLVFNKEDSSLKCFNRATKSYLLCILLFNL